MIQGQVFNTPTKMVLMLTNTKDRLIGVRFEVQKHGTRSRTFIDFYLDKSQAKKFIQQMTETIGELFMNYLLTFTINRRLI